MTAYLQAEIHLICLLVTALLLKWTGRNGTNSTAEQWLRRLLTVFLAYFASNLCGTLATCAPVPMELRIRARWFFATLSHIALCGGVVTWCGLANAQNHGRLFTAKKTRVLTPVLLLLPPAALALANLRTGWLFTVTPEAGLAKGWLFHSEMGYLLALAALFCSPLLRRLPREVEPTRMSHLKLMASFPLCLAVAWGLTAVSDGLPVIGACILIELLCLYMDANMRQISMDKLTQVNNRQNLLSFLEYKIGNHEESIFLLMIDVDYFKEINDNFGHLEGDEALIQISGILKSACGGYRRRPYIGRYGGDEFIIILEGTQAEADSLCAAIHEGLRAVRESDDKPYDLLASIGVARWHPSMTPQAFISAADEQLYEIKRARKKPSRH